MARETPSVLHFRASSMAPRIAWLASGAGRIPFGPGELDPGGETGGLVIGRGFDQTQILDVAHQRGHAVIAQSPRMKTGWGERRPQGVHFGERGQVGGVAEIVGELSPGEAGTGRGFHSDHADFFSTPELGAQERKHQPAKVGSAPGAPHQNIGIIVGHSHLFHGFQPHNGLVKQDMVQNRAQSVICVIPLGGHFHGLRNGNAETARMFWIFGQECRGPTGFRWTEKPRSARHRFPSSARR
jgi:hypothetical protein